LVEQVRSLAPPRRAVSREVTTTPSLAGVPDELVAALDASPDEAARAIRTWFSLHRTSPAHRAPLVAWVLHLPPESLPVVADGLRSVAADAAGTMLAATLTDLATTRHLMLHDLLPAHHHDRSDMPEHTDDP
jgi:hypothetical protein